MADTTPTPNAPSSATAAPILDAEQAAPRIIDENTDMTTLTDQEIMKLMEGMDHQDVQLDKVCTFLFRIHHPLKLME